MSVVSIIRDVGIVAAALVAMAGAAKVPIINRPGRWLWQRVVAEPVTAWAHQVIATAPAVREMHHELHRNDGSSLKDAVERMEDRTVRLEQGQDQIDRRFAEIVDRFESSK